MNVLLIGARGKVGRCVGEALASRGAKITEPTRLEFNLERPEALKSWGRFDAVVSCAGEVSFGAFSDLGREAWQKSVASKLLGQIALTHAILPALNDGGSITLISGIVGEHQIKGGAIASTINFGLQGFVRAAALELPRGLRLNLVSPTVLEESMPLYADAFPGFTPVAGRAVAQAFVRAVYGVETGRVLRVGYEA